MKKCFLAGLGLVAATFLTVSCSDDLGKGVSENNGRINPFVSLDSEVISSRSTDPSSRADNTSTAEAVSVTDLSLRLTKADGSDSWSWSKIADFDTEKEFAVGAYNLEAFYGDKANQGFDLPAYYGSQSITVNDGETTHVSLTASLANAMVAINYTDAFQNYMAQWSASVNGVDYSQSETRAVYVTPGEVTVKLSVTKPNGVGATFTLDPVQAEARHLYTVTVDVNSGNVGDAALTVSFDEMMDEEEITIDLSDKLLMSPEPELSASGFNNGETIELIAGQFDDMPLSMNIVALAGIKEVIMTTTSKSLISQGWPATINLLGADAAVQKQLTDLGLNVLGLWKNPGEMAVVDFSNVLSHINPVKDNFDNIFTVTVKDKLLRESNELTLSVNIQDIAIELADAGEKFFPGNTFHLTILYNGDNLPKDRLTVEYKDPQFNMWRPAEVTDVKAASRALNSFSVAVTAPEVEEDALDFRASLGAAVSNEITIERKPYDWATDADANNVFAHSAYIAVEQLLDTPVPALSGAQVLLKKGDDKDYSPVTANVVGNYLLISNLDANADYTVKVNFDGTDAKRATFHTESELAIPNGDFEALSDEVSATVNQGGTWNTSVMDFLSSYQNTANITYREPQGWATTNAKTTNNLEWKNTWFNIPSVFNSGVSYVGNCSGISGGAGKSSDTPASYKGFAAHGGENAMVVRSVAWDANGSVPGRDTNSKSNASQYYNKTVPTVANKSAGKMFLGSFSFADGADTYNEGVTFNSRPAALTGWYTYSPDNGDTDDYGVVTVEVMNGSTVVAKGTANLTSTGDYKEFTINLTYTPGVSLKATSIRVMVSSSYHDADSSTSVSNDIAVTNFVSRYESYKHGATLVVDDFKFVY